MHVVQHIVINVYTFDMGNDIKNAIRTRDSLVCDKTPRTESDVINAPPPRAHECTLRELTGINDTQHGPEPTP